MVDEESRFKKRVEEIKTKQAKMDEVNHEKMI
jgi:L-lactate utilization protein LutC